MEGLIVFDHVPYSGGYTAACEMVRLFDSEQAMQLAPDTERDTLGALTQDELKSLRFIAGHTVYGLLDDRDIPISYVTMLRHPVNRFLSHYYWWKRLAETGSTHEGTQCIEYELIRSSNSIEEFLRKYLEIRDHFEWSQVHYLLHRHIPEKEVTQAKGMSCYQPEIVDVVLEEISEAYDLVLVTELFEESLVRFSDYYQLSFPRCFQKIPYSGANWDELDLSEEVLDTVRHLCRIELEVYQQVRNKFEQETEYLLDETFVGYKSACIVNDEKFSRHFFHGGETYLHAAMRQGATLRKCLNDKVWAHFLERSRKSSELVELSMDHMDVFDGSNQSQSFMIWGTSGFYEHNFRQAVLACQNRMFKGFIDNDENQQGKVLDGYPVYSPDEVLYRRLNPDVIIIASEFVTEISDQIKRDLRYVPLLCGGVVVSPQ